MDSESDAELVDPLSVKIVAAIGPNGEERDVLETLRAEILDADMVALACESLANMTLELDGPCLVAMGLANHLLIALRVNSDIASVQRPAFSAIANLAEHGTAMKRHCVDLGAPLDIVKGLQGHPAHAGVQESAFFALGVLADDEHMGTLVDHGLCEAVVSAVRRTSEAAWVGTMIGLTRLTQVRAIKTKLLELGLTPLVLKGLKDAGTRDATLAGWCLRTLFNLCDDDEFDPRLALLIGASALQAMRKHPTEAEVQIGALQVMSRLCISLDAPVCTTTDTTAARENASKSASTAAATAQKLVQMGAAQLAVASLREHAASQPVSQQGVHALKTWAVHEECRAAVAFAGKDVEWAMQGSEDDALLQYGCAFLCLIAPHSAVGPEAVLEVLRRAKTSRKDTDAETAVETEMAVQACVSLESLCGSAQGRERLVAAHAGRVLLRVMRAYAGEAEVFTCACNALQRLAQQSAAGFLADVLSLGAARVILRAMESHGADVAVQESACLFFALVQSLNKEPAMASATRQLVNLGAAAAVVRTMLSHADCELVAEVGLRALGELVKLDPGLAQADDAVIGALQKHATALVQQHGCFAMCALAKDGDSQKRLLAKGAGSAVVGALHKHMAACASAGESAESAVLWQGCAAVCSLGEDNPAAAKELVALGAIQNVFNALLAPVGAAKHGSASSHRIMQMLAVHALTMLVRGEGGRKVCKDLGVGAYVRNMAVSGKDEELKKRIALQFFGE